MYMCVVYVHKSTGDGVGTSPTGTEGTNDCGPPSVDTGSHTSGPLDRAGSTFNLLISEPSLKSPDIFIILLLRVAFSHIIDHGYSFPSFYASQFFPTSSG